MTFAGARRDPRACRRGVTDFFAASKTIRHEIRNIVVEEAAGKVATEQGYIGELQDGSQNDMHNCNFFDFDADGKFKRVIIWMAGTNRSSASIRSANSGRELKASASRPQSPRQSIASRTSRHADRGRSRREAPSVTSTSLAQRVCCLERFDEGGHRRVAREP